MNLRVVLETTAVLPEPIDVLRRHGLPVDATPAERVGQLVGKALELLSRFAAPRGVLRSISSDEFAAIHAASENTEGASPLESIHPRAAHLALFVVTLGDLVSRGVDDLFKAGDYPLGAMLDFAASAAGEKAADLIEARWREELPDAGGEMAALRYSPGYCGWSLRGQRPVFDFLSPRSIGVSLGESCLMQPLKTISGLIVLGDPAIHAFENTFACCEECRDPVCRERIARVAEAN